ncbi:MAG: site-specific DNA-methyltransferase [Urechidicola sp.]|nr:site-specific DNA-methyltransferase [Urechidicola sp.]
MNHKLNFNSYPKPETLIGFLIKAVTKENDIVLDYHLGSGTTASTAHKMNRQYIGIEQMDYIETVAVERLKKVIDGEQGGISKAINWKGGGSFTYLELKKYNQTFIEQIEKSKDSKTLLKIWEQMKAKSFLNYNVDIQKQEEHIEEFKKLELSQQKEHLIELLDKNQLYVNLSSMNDKDFEVSNEEKQVTQDFYQIKE